MTTRLERVTEEYKGKFPHMKQYAACQSKAFMTGCFTFLAGGASVYLAQELLRSRLPCGRNYFLLLPIAVGTVSSYAMTRHNTRVCQEMWLAMEEKHSDITPLQGNMILKQKMEGPRRSSRLPKKRASCSCPDCEVEHAKDVPQVKRPKQKVTAALGLVSVKRGSSLQVQQEVPQAQCQDSQTATQAPATKPQAAVEDPKKVVVHDFRADTRGPREVIDTPPARVEAAQTVGAGDSPTPVRRSRRAPGRSAKDLLAGRIERRDRAEELTTRRRTRAEEEEQHQRDCQKEDELYEADMKKHLSQRDAWLKMVEGKPLPPAWKCMQLPLRGGDHIPQQ